MKVFVVDDDPVTCAMLSSIVASIGEGNKVEMFANGQSAMARCTLTDPDLVLLDFDLPDLSGIQVLQQLREKPSTREVPVVILTSANDRYIRQEALEAGATDFATKPIEPSEAKARIKNLLEIRRAHIQLKDQNVMLSWSVERATQKILAREEELIIRLAKAAEFRDAETGTHIQRMAHFSFIIAKKLDLPDEDCDIIRRAAPMHDIGKLGIPDAILLKRGKLNLAETKVMRSHPRIGFNILDGSESALVKMGAQIALRHHERFDGSGYPDGLHGNAIPIAGRIVAVSDVFDALTSARPYKPAWRLGDARRYLEEHRGSHFDPACVDAFLSKWVEVVDVLEEYKDPEIAAQ